jgi:hypothetical protein
MADDETHDLTQISDLLKALESRNCAPGHQVDRIGAFDGTPVSLQWLTRNRR